MPESKQCIVCDKELESMFDDWATWQPDDGADVRIEASYGSRFDLTKFRGVICDDCVEKNVHKLEKTILKFEDLIVTNKTQWKKEDTESTPVKPVSKKDIQKIVDKKLQDKVDYWVILINRALENGKMTICLGEIQFDKQLLERLKDTYIQVGWNIEIKSSSCDPRDGSYYGWIFS